jgi:hypothetical protein
METELLCWDCFDDRLGDYELFKDNLRVGRHFNSVEKAFKHGMKCFKSRKSSGLRCSVVLWQDTNVSEVHAASIFSLKMDAATSPP